MQTSYGIICTRFTGKEYEFLMIKRRTSYAFTNFVLGKYSIKNENKNTVFSKVHELFSQMTVEEKSLIIYGNFDVLYYTAFCLSKLDITDKKMILFYEKCKQKFELYFSPQILKNLCVGTSSINHTWDFPKGRQGVEESTLESAVREFEEETSYNSKNYTLVDKDPLILEFKSDVNYKYILYFAYTDKIISAPYRICNEISDLAWFSASKAKFFLRSEFKPYIPKIIKHAKKIRKELNN
jgi:8-oxo-dGTP pyrophosphatase MutT (NUDIX family)